LDCAPAGDTPASRAKAASTMIRISILMPTQLYVPRRSSSTVVTRSPAALAGAAGLILDFEQLLGVSASRLPYRASAARIFASADP